jgi:hypothetical protein
VAQPADEKDPNGPTNQEIGPEGVGIPQRANGEMHVAERLVCAVIGATLGIVRPVQNYLTGVLDPGFSQAPPGVVWAAHLTLLVFVMIWIIAIMYANRYERTNILACVVCAFGLPSLFTTLVQIAR